MAAAISSYVSIKCASCGKFIAYSELDKDGGARFYFEPDSHFGSEYSEWTCKKCTEKVKRK